VLGGSKVEGQMVIGYESWYMPTYAIDSQSNSKKQFWYITTVLKTYEKQSKNWLKHHRFFANSFMKTINP
jgi:hypothetical protein